MTKSRSYNAHKKLKELILSKDSYLIEDDELYQLIKEDYHEKQTNKALKLVKPYLIISYTDKKKDNCYYQMLKESSEKNITYNSFSHFRIEDNPIINSQKNKNNSISNSKCSKHIPLPNIKTNISLNLSKTHYTVNHSNEKQNNKYAKNENYNNNNNSTMKTEIKSDDKPGKSRWPNRSLSANNFTIETIKKKEISVYKNLNRKISLNKLLLLRSRFFANEKMNRGELTEMMFGNQIPFYKHKSICDDLQNKVFEVLSNSPKLIVDLIEKGYVDKKDVIEYFNLESLNIEWNDELEKKFREIGYNRTKTNSNMLKTTYFLVNIGFHRILRQKFEEKNYKNTNTYNQSEIEEISKIYEKLKKYDLNRLLEGYSKVDDIYHLREVIINDKINEIREEYYNKKLKIFFKNKNKTDIIIEKVVKKQKKEMENMKSYIFHIRENKDWNYQNINKLRFSNPITKINKSIKEEINIKNMSTIDKIKKTKKYIKEIIKVYQKEGKLPSIYSSTKFSFDWKHFMNESKENKKIIKYFIILIQSKFRGFMVKVFLSKIIRSVDIITNNLDKYIGFKKLVLQLYKTTFEEIVANKKNDNYDYKSRIKELRKLIRFIIKNSKSRRLLFKKQEIDLINKLEESNIGFVPIRIEQAIYSIKLLLILDKYLFYLYHGYI
jgi:hypothetical protein